MGESMLQSELKKRKPFELAEEEAILNLLRTADVVNLPFERLFEHEGISGPQYNVLRILRGHGTQGLPCTEIGEQMISRMPDMTRLVDRLERAGLVKRRRTAADRRVVLICITTKGLELVNRLDEPVQKLHKQTLGHLTRAELSELNRLLAKARTPP